MDYTPYYETMRRTRLLRGMTDAELDTLMTCFAPRVRRYAKGELLLMAGLRDPGSRPGAGRFHHGQQAAGRRQHGRYLPHGAGRCVCRCLAGGRSRSPVNVAPLPRPAWRSTCPAKRCCALRRAAQRHLKLLQNWLETISDKYFALDRRLELICCKSLRGRICMWLLEQRERCGADTFTTSHDPHRAGCVLNCDRSALSPRAEPYAGRRADRAVPGSFKLPDPERLHAACP